MEEGCLAIPNEVASIIIVHTRILTVVERTESMSGSQERGPQRCTSVSLYLVVTAKRLSQMWDGVSHKAKFFREAWESGSMVVTVPSDVSRSEGQPMGWYEGGGREW